MHARTPLQHTSHTSLMNRTLLPKTLASLKPQNQQNRRNCNEKPEYLHESLCKSESVSTEFKPALSSNIHPHLSCSDPLFLKHWSVEYLKINKKRKPP